MATLTRSVFVLEKLVARCALPQVLSARSAGHWNDDWKPGQYPKTEAERVAAARKYGLLPEDYEPYPDDGMGYGDYPKLPVVSAEMRDPYENFDFPAHRRNYGEPLHVDFDMYGLDRVNARHDAPISQLKMLLSFLGLMTFIVVATYLAEYVKPPCEKKPKQLPNKGEVHYTFDPVEE